MIRVHLVFVTWNIESGRQRAERDVELPAVPRVGEVIWVARMLSLKVASITWMLEDPGAEDPRPWIWLGRGADTTAAIRDLGGEHEVPARHMDELVAAGWVLSPND